MNTTAKIQESNVMPLLWNRIRGWFVQNAVQSNVVFIPEPGRYPVPANAGYLRLWLAEGFLAQAVAWGTKQFPALHGAVSLSFLGSEPVIFSSFTRPPQSWKVPGVQLDFPITPLLPFSGGVVEIEAALFKASQDGPLGVAVNLLSSLTTLLGPPLATAAAIADKVSDGLDMVLGATDEQPVLGVHWTVISPGGGGNALMPGHLALVRAPVGTLPGPLVIHHGRLRIALPGRIVPLEGFDYLLLRIECRSERDDWRLPELDALIRSAGEAYVHHQPEVFAARRTEAIARAWNSVDLIPSDRKRVALLVKQELDSLSELGLLPAPERTVHEAALERMLPADDPSFDDLQLADLLG